MNLPDDLIQTWCNEWLKPPQTKTMLLFMMEKAAEFATAQERERCAKLCEDRAAESTFVATEITLTQAARSIRALPNGDSNEAK